MKIFINTNDWTISKIENETPIVTGDNYVDTINVYYNNDPAYLNIIPTLNLLKPNNRKVGSIPFDIGTIENPNPSSYTDEDSNTWYRFVFTLSSDNGQIDEKGKYQCTIVTNYLDTSGNITAQRNVNVQFNVFYAVKNENSNILILSESNPDQVIADVYQLVQTLSTSVSALGLSKVDKADIGYIEITYNGPVVQTITGTLTSAQLAEASKKYCILRLKSDIYGDNVPFINLFYKYAVTSGAYFFRTIPDVGSNQDASAFKSSGVLVFSNGDYQINAIETLFYNKSKADTLLAAKVDKTQKVNGHELSGDITLDKGDVGLGNVDNTSDANKPISNATQSALDQRIRYTEVVDNLSNTSTNKPLSANQGKQLKAMIDAINILLASDNVDLDTIQEIVNYIKNNKDLIDGITVTKINYTDIVDNLTSVIADKPLSAKQGYILKGLIDALNDAETGIQANEAVRILNESTRQSNEAARVSAEEARQTGYSGFDTRITANANAISGIKDGTNIDSFADVESALSTKANTSDVYAKSEVYTKAETEALQSATLDASKSYTDKVADDLRWELGTYDLGVDTDNSVARVKTLHANTIKSMVDYIGGKSVKYNQFAREINSTNWGVASSDYGSVSFNGNEITYTLSVGGSVGYGIGIRTLLDITTSSIQNHQLLIYFQAKSSRAGVSLGGDITNKAFTISSPTTTTNYQVFSAIITTSNNTSCYICIRSNNTEIGDTFTFKDIELIDLTDKFGAGNEPSTVETVIPLLKANGYKLDGTDTYSTGSLKHAVVSGVEYDGNLWNFTSNDLELGTISGAGQDVTSTTRIRIKNTSKLFLKAGTYTISFNNLNDYACYGYINATDSDSVLTPRGFNTDMTFTLNNDYYVRFVFRYSDNRTITSVNELSNVMLVKGTTAPSTYIPYVAPITKAIPSEVLADTRYGLGFDNTNYNHLDIDGHLRGSYAIVDLSTLNWDYTTTFNWRANLNVANRGNAICSTYTCSTNRPDQLEVEELSTYWGWIDTVARIIVNNGSDTTRPSGYLVFELTDAFDQDYSQYFTPNWNKADLDKLYATCEMVCDEPIDMPNSITNLFEEVKA